jgi:alkaline phosphatase D
MDFLDEPADSVRRTQQTGINATYTFGPAGRRVRLILLDHRWQHSRQRREFVGGAQLDWLAGLLRNNDAQLTLIASGIQVRCCPSHRAG